MTTELPGADWYPDPSGKPGMKYWDGQQWHLDVPDESPPGPANAASQMPQNSRGRQLQRSVYLAVAGTLITVFCIAGLILNYLRQPNSINFSEFPFRLCFSLSWLLLAVAFGLIAIRCRSSAPQVAGTAWLTCAAALMTPLMLVVPWALSSWSERLMILFSPATLLALIAFGVTAHRPFGWWWSVPAMVTGVFGVLVDVHIWAEFHPYADGLIWYENYSRLFPSWEGAIWLIPLSILAMSMVLTPAGQAGPPRPAPHNLSTQLAGLNDALHAGLITEQEYARKRADIIGSA